jgi:hypothetical protein
LFKRVDGDFRVLSDDEDSSVEGDDGDFSV